MSRRTHNRTVSLFPFLAVLVCTMGALILLLLVTTRRIRQEQFRYSQAEATFQVLQAGQLPTVEMTDASVFVASPDSRQKLPETAPPPLEIPDQWLPDQQQRQRRLKHLQQDIAALETGNQDQVSEQQRLQQVLADLNSEVAELQQESDLLTAAIEQSESQKNDPESLEQELQQHRQKTEQLTEHLQLATTELQNVQAELEQQSELTEQAESLLTRRKSALIALRSLVSESSERLTAGTDQTLLEFTNPDGTARTPIVINVDGNGFRFEPSDVLIRPDDLTGFPANDNPLITAVFALAEHRANGQLNHPPYVLLLVRPKGSLGFYKAQRALQDANVHFGYELMEDDRTVALPPADDQEIQIVRQSILEALNRRAKLYGAVAGITQDRMQSELRQQLQSGNRRVKVLPNGQLIVENETTSDGDRPGPEFMADMGRYYAGGQPLPADYQRRRQQIRQTIPSDPVDRRQASSGDAIQWQQPESSSAVEAPVPSFAKSSPMDTVDTWTDPPLVTQQTQSATTAPSGSEKPDISDDMGWISAAAEDEEPFEQTEDSSALWTEPSDSTPSPTNSETRSFPQPVLTAPTLNRRTLADNLGLTILPDDRRDPIQATDAFDPFSGFQPVPTTNELRIDRPEQTAQKSNSGSRPVDPAVTSQQPFAQGNTDDTVTPDVSDDRSLNSSSQAATAFVPQGNAMTEPSTTVAPDDSYLQKFLDQVQDAQSDAKPNPVLLRLLKRSQQNAKDSLSENLTRRDTELLNAQPVSSNGSDARSQSVDVRPARKTDSVLRNDSPSAESPSPVYYVVRVYVSDDRLIIGRFKPINIAGWSPDKVLDATFVGTSRIMDGVWQQLRPDALPAVRFLIADGSQDLQQFLTTRLQELQIPTRAVQLEGRDLQLQDFFAESLPPTTQASAQPAGRSDR